MSILVKNIKNNNIYILLGTGFSYYKDSRPGAFGGNLIPHIEEGQYRMAAVCDNTGNIKWFETDDLKVIKIDGHDVCSLIEETKEEHNKDQVPSYCPACGASIFEDNKVCGSCGITLIIDDENLPKLY